MTSGAGEPPPQLAPLQRALQRYDPILGSDLVLDGILHFPEVEKVLPDFYRQLYERVHLRLVVSRHSFSLEPEGRSEELKAMVREQFLKIEDELRTSFSEMLENDPLVHLGQLQEHLASYTMAVAQEANLQYRFNLRENTALRLPQVLEFELSPAGRLLQLTCVEKQHTLSVTFTTSEIEGRYYITGLDVVQKKHGLDKYRRVDIEYQLVSGVRCPARIMLTTVDGQGRPVLVSGNLNPLSLVFHSVRVTRRKEDGP